MVAPAPRRPCPCRPLAIRRSERQTPPEGAESLGGAIIRSLVGGASRPCALRKVPIPVGNASVFRLTASPGKASPPCHARVPRTWDRTKDFILQYSLRVRALDQEKAHHPRSSPRQGPSPSRTRHHLRRQRPRAQRGSLSFRCRASACISRRRARVD